MAYDAIIEGYYSGRPAFVMILYCRRDQTDQAGNRSTYLWALYQRNNSAYASWELTAKTWSVGIASQGFSGQVNCDFRGLTNGGQRTVAMSTTNWFGHDSDGYLNVGFVFDHDAGGTFGRARQNGVLYSDRIPKPPATPGATVFSMIQPTTARSVSPNSSNDNGAAVEYQTLRISTNPNPEIAPWNDITVDRSNGIVDLTGLTPGLTYYGRTFSHNPAGDSGWSQTTSFKTLSGAYVAKDGIYQGSEVLVGSGGAFVTAGVYIGKDGVFVLAT